MSKFILLFFLLLNITTLSAEEITVSLVTSDIDRDVVHIILETDERNELTYLHTDTYIDGVFSTRNTHSFDRVNNGFVILKKDKYNVVTLYSDDFASYAGGTIRMKYMTSGLSNSYSSKYFNITQTEDSWQITDSSSKRVKGFFFQAKKIWGKIIGIKNIIYKY